MIPVSNRTTYMPHRWQVSDAMRVALNTIPPMRHTLTAWRFLLLTVMDARGPISDPSPNASMVRS